jgi:hypothetical protein
MAVILIFYLSYFLAKIRRFYPQFPLRNLFFNQADLFHQELDIVLFDTTSLVYYGDGPDARGEDKPEDEQLLDYGFSKARRSDLKQIVVGILMSKDGIPLAHEAFSGNTNDV